jgi:hypothetical protein
MMACFGTSWNKRLFTLMLPLIKEFLSNKNVRDLDPISGDVIPLILHTIGTPETLELLKKFRPR